MRKYISLLLICILIMSGTIYPVQSENTRLYESVVKEKVTKGLDYEYKQIFTKDGWVDVHVLIMDLDEEQVAMKILQSTDEFGLKKTMTNLAAENENIVGGINGSFFNMTTNYSDPQGVIYDEGYVSASHNYNVGQDNTGVASLIQKNSGDIFFDFFGVSITLTNDLGRSLYIGGINKIKVSDNPIIYNEAFGKDSSQIDQLGSFYKLRVIDDMVITVSSPTELATMPPMDSGYIIAIPSSIAPVHLDYFKPGTKINLNIKSTIDTADIKYAISGSGKVVENGQLVAIGDIIEKNSRHPRSAIGITSDQKKLIAMVVDGRGTSIGATHEELGRYLLSYNVSDAIQLDGGGSSTLISRDLGETQVDVQNKPSGGAQRKVLNGIGFVSLGLPGQLTTIKIIPSTTTVFKNNPIYLDIIGYDENYNPVEIDRNKIVWNVDKLQGTWQLNTFIPSVPGNGKLTCYYNGLTANISLKSLDKPIDLNVSPRILSLDYNKTGSFELTGLDNSGFEGAINKVDAIYTLENPAIGSFVNGEFKSSVTTGISKVKIQVGDRWTTAYIAVGNEKQTVTSFEKAKFESRVYPESITLSAVTLDETKFLDTTSSYKFDYNFISSPDSQALYMMLDNFVIEQPTDMISLNIFGNESGHMFKGKVIDAKGRAENITFVSDINFTGWKEVVATLPTDLVYPIKLDRLYVVSLMAINAYKGSLNIDKLSVMSRLDTSKLRFDDEGFIADELKLTVKPKDSFELKVFGPTAFRNRLLDNILLEKVYEKMNQANYATFAGTTDITAEKIKVPYSTWNNTYNEFIIEGVKFIQLGTTSGGLRSTDYTQYSKLTNALATTTQNTIVIIGNKNPLTNFTDPKEGQLLHNILKDHVAKSGKTLMYINAGGYETNVTIRDNIRYFDLSGMWYKIEDRHVALNETFYSLNFYIKSGQIKYMIEPLYPLIEVMGE